MNGGMDDMIRLHSSANFSFDLNQKGNILTFDPLEAQRKAIQNKHSDNVENNEQLICRICLCEEEFPDHELIAPCKC